MKRFAAMHGNVGSAFSLHGLRSSTAMPKPPPLRGDFPDACQSSQNPPPFGSADSLSYMRVVLQEKDARAPEAPALFGIPSHFGMVTSLTRSRGLPGVFALLGGGGLAGSASILEKAVCT